MEHDERDERGREDRERIEGKCDGTERRRCMSGGKEKGGDEREREKERERERRRFTPLKPSV